MQALRLCLAADHLTVVVVKERGGLGLLLLAFVLAVCALEVSERLLTEPGGASSSLNASTMLNEAERRT